MPTNIYTPAQIVKISEDYFKRRGKTLHAIIKEVPKGSGRKLLLGIEYPKESKNYKKKFMLRSPIELNKLHNGPITKSGTANDDGGTGSSPSTPAVPGSGSVPLGNDSEILAGNE